MRELVGGVGGQRRYNVPVGLASYVATAVDVYMLMYERLYLHISLARLEDSYRQIQNICASHHSSRLHTPIRPVGLQDGQDALIVQALCNLHLILNVSMDQVLNADPVWLGGGK